MPKKGKEGGKSMAKEGKSSKSKDANKASKSMATGSKSLGNKEGKGGSKSVSKPSKSIKEGSKSIKEGKKASSKSVGKEKDSLKHRKTEGEGGGGGKKSTKARASKKEGEDHKKRKTHGKTQKDGDGHENKGGKDANNNNVDKGGAESKATPKKSGAASAAPPKRKSKTDHPPEYYKDGEASNDDIPIPKKKRDSEGDTEEDEDDAVERGLHRFFVHREPMTEDVLTHEEILPPLMSERKYARHLERAFHPTRMLMSVFFRFPFKLDVEDEEHGGKHEHEHPTWKRVRTQMFFVTALLFEIALVLALLGVTAIMFDTPDQPSKKPVQVYYPIHETEKNKANRTRQYRNQKQLRMEELYLLHRNFVPMLLLILSLIHLVIADFQLFKKRKFLGRYFSHWKHSVEIMRMDAAKYPQDVKKFTTQVILSYVVMCMVVIVLCGFRIAPLATGAPNQLVILWARPFYPHIHSWRYIHWVRWLSTIVIVYALMCSQIYAILLIYFCKLLKNCFSTWNERLVAVVHDEMESKRNRRENCEHRTGLDHLFKDFTTLLDLLRGADTVFAYVLESYLATYLFTFCFEVYYLIRCFTTATTHEFEFARKLDGIIVGANISVVLFMFILVLNMTSEVGEIAMEGLEVLRSEGVLARTGTKEMYFKLSLYLSYTGPFDTALTAGRYVIFDKGFIMAVGATILSYYIILSQFSVPLAILDKDQLAVIPSTKSLILQSEATRQGFDLVNTLVADDKKYALGYR